MGIDQTQSLNHGDLVMINQDPANTGVVISCPNSTYGHQMVVIQWQKYGKVSYRLSQLGNVDKVSSARR